MYESDFWDYESIKPKGNKVTLILRKGEQTISLEVENRDNNTLNIKNGKSKAQQYALAGKIYPDYPVADNTPFPAPTFQQDSVTIRGYYHNLDKVPEKFLQQYGIRSFEISISNYITNGSTNYLTNIDSLGRFSITVPVVNAQETYTDWKRITQNVVLEPGSDLFIFADINDFLPLENENWDAYRDRAKQIMYMGKNARVNNEVSQYKSPGIFIDRYEDNVINMSHMDYLKLCDDTYNRRVEYLNNYISEHPTLSEKFRFYRTEYEKYNSASYIMQRRFDLKRNSGERFTNEYMEYVADKFPLTDERVFTLIREFGSFLRDYVGYAEDGATQSVTVDLNMVEKKLEKDGTLTNEIRNDVARYNEIIQTYEQLTDSLEKINYIESQSAFFEQLNKKPIITETIQKIFTNTFFEKNISSVDTMITNPHLKELYTSSLYYDMLDNSRLPLDKAEMTVFNERVKTPYLRKTLLDINEHYATIGQKKMEHEESLKDTQHLESVREFDELFKQLTEAYKGKVIYLDFWGTWCGPCRQNMKLMGGIKDSLKGKDVVYMYLANNSPDQTWRSIIKEMSLTGDNIVHYNLPPRQQAMLEQSLSVNSWPTYMLIDKDGNIVNKRAPSPREKDNLVNEIEQLLNK